MNLIQLFLKISGVRIFLPILTSLLSGISSVGLIALINTVLQGTNSSRGILAISFLGLCLLMLISTAMSQIYISRVAEKIIFDLRLRLTSSILACPLRHIEEIGIPRLLAALSQDIETIANASIPTSFLCVSIALLLMCLAYLSWLSLPLFGLTLILIAIGISSNQYLVYRGRYFLKSAREVQDILFQHFRTTTEGIKELKMNQQRRQAFLEEDLQPIAAKSRNYRTSAANFFAIGGSWGLVALFVLNGVLLFIAPLLFTVPNSVISGYVLTLIFMLAPMRTLLSSIPELVQANIALDNINSLGLLLATQSSEFEQISQTDYQFNWKSLQLRNLFYTYKGDQDDSCFTIGPIDLALHAGEVLFIVGGNGSGKSTLVKLLTGLYTPETGHIKFGDQYITNNNLDWYRQQFSVVFSDFYLFDRLLGLQELSRNHQVQAYLKQLRLNHKVKINNGTFSTIALSQGQRKRLALLTTYLEDRPIFVFDEWASDQDPTFKKIFYTQVLQDLKQRGKAVVVVTHDDHYFDQADRILKLNYGKIEHERNTKFGVAE